jgi:NAD(P)-dependent dehydrogenase (short-subunit alcohol dehydrogenase family)
MKGGKMKLEGKSCLITGANSGLGFATVKRFAAEGAHIILVCRDAAKTETTMQAIRADSPSARLDGFVADLSSIKSTKNLVDQVRSSFGSLDVLINNAALAKLSRTITRDGFETMIQTNYIAPFILSNGLVGLMTKDSPSQIINIAGSSPKLRVNFEDLQFEQKFSSLDSFFQTKLYLLLSSLELSEKLAGSNLAVNCMEPGAFQSNLSREAPGFLRWIAGAFSATPESASRYVQIMVEKTGQPGFTGRVFSRDKEKPVVDYWKDKSVRKKLWDETETLISHSTNR